MECDHHPTRHYATPLPGRVLRLDTVCGACGDTLWTDMQPAGEAA